MWTVLQILKSYNKPTCIINYVEHDVSITVSVDVEYNVHCNDCICANVCIHVA